MSNYRGRKPDFIPAVYTRYFEQAETAKTSNDHIHFNEETEETSTNYQIKRDLIFKRLFPSKYADSNNNTTDPEQSNSQRKNTTAQTLGDFIPLFNNNSSTISKSSESHINLSSADEIEEDLLTEDQFPSSKHESIVGNLHPCATIENVRTILIRELYERTSDPHTEWLKCKMNIPSGYINPKYYADFQRRYRHDIKKNSMKTKKSRTDDGYNVYDLTTADETATQINTTLENDSIIEISSRKPVANISSSSSILLLNDSLDQSKSTPEYIILDDDDDSDDNLNQDPNNSTYFIDRSSNSLTAISQPKSTTNDDYQKEDSKYAQLPSRNASSSSIIRPILSKSQRRRQSHSSTPLVSAIDRIMDQMDQSDVLDNLGTIEEQNLLIKQMKKRKKKKKKTKNVIN